MSSSSTMALSPAIAATVRPPSSHDCLSSSATIATTTTTPMSLKSCIAAPLPLSTPQSRIKRSISRTTPRFTIRCGVATKSADSVNLDASSASSSEEEIEAKAKIGSRVRVTAPLKVYHVNRVPEVDLEGMEGKLKDYVSVWKGKRVSANLPYKVEFFIEIEGRGPVKSVSHLKDDEFDFIDQ
ncbi:PREDICTED: ferredoxin-thioredoxin reductase, variable chain [Camelina sativa]|uniref:Ferredoxin-thioredoxin reductase, variable chain n=1 Tax=Camelina sativa TaxID=90675 RepID=A0ABM0VDQ3_CAMSA|nr:PREDICTED: ferredoxin-thioredoxin reductase, variable chain [Camelina sativa]XP_010454629.1 PREDICTED: ferredoxin-thioredoxin reductase, variable chain [Camelina sativa]XP_010454630.1 PREDICTED: ferredoxin-thioredoxin reductase, variable chain [Camelina sativa]